MRAALEPWRGRFGFSLEVVDIDGDPALEARFGTRVPVLAEGGREICHYFLDEAALRTHLLRGIAEG
ncbi:MAG: glutaredoxin family protein [Gammaproteobacteria bacterium]|nr:glutaredoxin family protein [Gammaproteobacteria bacterium]NIR81750.1 glutaredoxin family protein [Gammaproteobacteria bacterium]NIR88553.1 glutaredoxin family protein [Gammaproteobacteria bacterium]NIU02857.1 glutaredoxin family protein [Gammaproteobacteria bacterium]NIV50379.1 glutaredoxin family protein [Gammaproteobacteria bacterium]